MAAFAALAFDCLFVGRPFVVLTRTAMEAMGTSDRYHLYHATPAELLRALGRRDEARVADQRALEPTENPVERALLAARLA